MLPCRQLRYDTKGLTFICFLHAKEALRRCRQVVIVATLNKCQVPSSAMLSKACCNIIFGTRFQSYFVHARVNATDRISSSYLAEANLIAQDFTIPLYSSSCN